MKSLSNLIVILQTWYKQNSLLVPFAAEGVWTPPKRCLWLTWFSVTCAGALYCEGRSCCFPVTPPCWTYNKVDNKTRWNSQYCAYKLSMSVVLDVSCWKPFIPQCREAANVALTAKVTYNIFEKSSGEETNPSFSHMQELWEETSVFLHELSTTAALNKTSPFVTPVHF